jgi:4-hydroxy-tetrahydrodipicolinate reductase
MIFPKPGLDLSDPANFASIGMTVTGMPALAAIAGVAAAPLGPMTRADLPLRRFVGRFKPQMRHQSRERAPSVRRV